MFFYLSESLKPCSHPKVNPFLFPFPNPSLEDGGGILAMRADVLGGHVERTFPLAEHSYNCVDSVDVIRELVCHACNA